VQQAGESPKRVLQLGLTFTAGIISSFMTLAAVVIAVQKAGQNVGWGFQFQYPGFVVAMSVLVTLLALSLFGLFYVSVPAGQGTVDKLASKEGFGGTFFKGVLATILATPCTAPFLGTALGFAFSQPWWVTASIFLSIALGMSFPYLLLTANPKWMRFIPKPGVWMETFKESLGFILLATVLWLLFILGKQLGVDALIWTTAFLLSVAFAAWFISRLTDLNSSRQRKYVVWAIAMMVVLGSYSVCLTKVFGIQPETEKLQPAQASVVPSAGTIVWEPFSVQKLDQELNANKTVFIDFTADWCLTCKVNEETVINTAPVISQMKALNVVTIKADWTKQNPEITKILQKFGRSGVPLYVIFPAGKPTEPIVLPEVITQEIVLDKLKEAGASS
jgi:thiol:disulfide interchange protein DsbD